jgi:nicotinamide-nucleotide amidase
MSAQLDIYADILAIGDEILYGQIVDTNGPWLSRALGEAGFRIRRKTALGDRREEIWDALEASMAKAQVVVLTGGLGPTKDDLTKQLLADFFGVGLTHRPEVLAHLEGLFAHRPELLNALNRQQADVPANADVLMNHVGTAPGMWFEHEGRVVISMPGVPHEMERMMAEQAIPRLRKHFRLPHIYHRMVKTIGVAEAVLAETIADWEAALPEPVKLAYLPNLGQVRLRLTAVGEDPGALRALVEQEVERLKPLIGEHIFAYDNEEVEHTVGKLLLGLGKTLATAESCTGGAIAQRITQVAGCSAYYQGGIVAYSNEVKNSQLGVPSAILEAHGAVSEATAKAMAEQARLRYGADFGLSTTGVAGPGGGSPEKPVGTVWVGYSDAGKTYARKFQLTKDRMMNVRFTYSIAMNLLRRELLALS